MIIGCAVLVTGISACAAASVPAGPVQSVPPPAQCGSAGTHGLAENTQMFTGLAALSCFSKAARACRAASIEVTVMGVDTGTNDVFTIEPGGKTCLVTEASQDYSANFGGSQGPVRTTTCRRTAVTVAGVTLACGGQDVLIPDKVSVP